MACCPGLSSLADDFHLHRRAGVHCVNKRPEARLVYVLLPTCCKRGHATHSAAGVTMLTPRSNQLLPQRTVSVTSQHILSRC